uniref:Magnesium-dependent phosphatase-1 n=1 Tax=Leersia perrieri TaxID=77586 RepID=A0A0D9XRQ3_9ORYZ
MAARPTADGEGVDASVPWWRRKRPRRPPPPPEADAEAVKAEALELMAAQPVLPRLVVFDLDHTLWPFQCDRLPRDEPPYLYPQARGILSALKDRGIEIAIASRASRTKGVAKSFLQKLGIHFMFGAQEIFYTWSPKSEHFQSIHRKTGVPFKCMLFFDDEIRNIIATRKLGVSCVLVEKGITLDKLRTGLRNYANSANSSASPNAEPAKGSISWYLNH